MAAASSNSYIPAYLWDWGRGSCRTESATIATPAPKSGCGRHGEATQRVPETCFQLGCSLKMLSNAPSILELWGQVAGVCAVVLCLTNTFLTLWLRLLVSYLSIGKKIPVSKILTP